MAINEGSYWHQMYTKSIMLLYIGAQQAYVHFQTMVRGASYSPTQSPTASIPSLQFLHHSELQGGAFQKLGEHPKEAEQQPSLLAFHSNHPCLLSLQ